MERGEIFAHLVGDWGEVVHFNGMQKERGVHQENKGGEGISGSMNTLWALKLGAPC